MAIVILRPNVSISNSGWTLNGAATEHEILSDDSDSTYLEVVGKTSVYVEVGFDSYTLAPLERVAFIRKGARTKTNNFIATQMASHYKSLGGSAASSNLGAVSGGPGTVYAAWQSDLLSPLDQQALIDDLSLLVTKPQTETTTEIISIYELYLELDVWEATDAPIVDVERGFQLNQGSVEPQPVVTKTKPTISFYTPSINDGTPLQWSRNVRLFDEARFLAPGFDPEGNALAGHGSTVLEDISNDPNNPGQTTFATELEVGASYRVYAKYGKNDVGGETLWSEWGFVEFYVAGPGPSVPPPVLLNSGDDMYVGTSQAAKIYSGTTQVWP